MKLFISLVTILIATSAMASTNLSGKYKNIQCEGNPSLKILGLKISEDQSSNIKIKTLWTKDGIEVTMDYPAGTTKGVLSVGNAYKQNVKLSENSLKVDYTFYQGPVRLVVTHTNHEQYLLENDQLVFSFHTENGDGHISTEGVCRFQKIE